jgi:hypothetical protein
LDCFALEARSETKFFQRIFNQFCFPKRFFFKKFVRIFDFCIPSGTLSLQGQIFQKCFFSLSKNFQNFENEKI